MEDIVEAIGDWWTEAIWWQMDGEGMVEVEEGE